MYKNACVAISNILTASLLTGAGFASSGFFSPRQLTLNASVTDLRKGNLYLSIVVPMQMEAPDVCEFEPYENLSLKPWETGRSFGLMRKLDEAGETEMEGKFLATGPSQACLDVNGNGCDEADPELVAQKGVVTLLGAKEKLGATLTPGCLEYQFWDGFAIGDHSRRASFRMRGEWGFPPLEEVEAIRSVGGGPILAGVTYGRSASLGVQTEVILNNTTRLGTSGGILWRNGETGQVVGASSAILPSNGSYRMTFGGSGPLTQVFGTTEGFSPQTVGGLQASAVFSTLQYQFLPADGLALRGSLADDVVQGSGEGIQLLGVAGLGTPSPAGEHTLAVRHSSDGENTGVLIVNPFDVEASLVLFLNDSSGNPVAEAPLVMGAQTSVSMFFLQYFGVEPAGSFEDFEGTLIISGNTPTAVITLGTQNGVQQFSLPAGSNSIAAN